MKYEHTLYGVFESRPNRFIARVWVEDVLETVHVKNTGRCGELLIPGVRVVLADSGNPKRKTRYDLICVYKEGLGWVNLDSQATNKVVAEWLSHRNYTYIRPEFTYADSRLDFYLERGEEKLLLEVKGCTLEIDGTGYFPDAVSERAHRHLRELAKAVSEGYHCIVAFVIAMEGVTHVLPNVSRDPEFGRALSEAREAGVEVWHMACRVSEDSLEIADVVVDQGRAGSIRLSV